MANTMKVEVVNEDVLTRAVINGPDPTNVLASLGNNVLYTTTQDCFAYNQSINRSIDQSIILSKGGLQASKSSFTSNSKRGGSRLSEVKAS